MDTINHTIVRHLAKRSGLIFSLFFIAFLVIIVWFMITGFSNSGAIMTIGIAALSTIFAAFSAFANLLQAVETQKQREIQERPYVIAHFDVVGNVIYFVIKNYGSSPALNIHVNIDPSPIDYSDQPLNKTSLLANPISFLAPGKLHRRLINVGHRILGEDKPKNFSITTSYESLNQEKFNEEFTENLSYLTQATIAPKSIEEVLPSLVNEVKDIKNMMQKITMSGAIMVETREQYESRIQSIIDDREADKDSGTPTSSTQEVQNSNESHIEV